MSKSLNSDWLTRSARVLAANYAPLPVALERGEGVWVWDCEGRRYLDCLAGYGALNFGHRHPQLIAAAGEQLQKITLTCRAFHSDELILLAEELTAFCGCECMLPMTSGAEAVETAIKICRRWGVERKGLSENEGEIIVFNNNFHGRTTTIIGFSDSHESRRGFGPFTPGFIKVRFGDIDALGKAFTSRTVGVLIEPIQGEAGVLIPPDGFLRQVREMCSDANVLFMADEIQTGFFRTGYRFAVDFEQVKPDIYILGKSLGGGIVPISAVVGGHNIFSVITPGSHGSTFGGNPFACRVARAVLQLMAGSDFGKLVVALGEHFRSELASLRLPGVVAVRGRGLMTGLDIDPAWGSAKEAAYQLLKEGVLAKDTRDMTLRITPPLIISHEEIAHIVAACLKVFAKHR